MSEEMYISGVTNCEYCNKFLTEFNECVKCNKLLCSVCIEKNKNKSCPLCAHSPFEIKKNEKLNRFIKDNKFICKFCKGIFNLQNIGTHECIVPIMTCKICQYQNRDETEFLKHINQKHREELIEIFSEE